jgi:AmmeMemoRadiSam system protein A
MKEPEDVLFTFTNDEKRALLVIARQAIHAAASKASAPPIDLDALSPSLAQPAACFVTLHIDDALRGCTGSLTARRPLAEEVSYTAVQTAFSDPRFPPVTPEEVPALDIEISVLTPSRPLHYTSAADLLNKLKPGVHGVTLRQGYQRATFLPQVWERIPEPEQFLSHLCRKMGIETGAWRDGNLEVDVYRVIAWGEAEMTV